MFNTIECFKRLIPVCHFSESHQKILAENASLNKLKQGEYLFREGETDNHSFFLLEGAIELQCGENNFVVSSDSDNANYALAQFQPRQYSAYVIEDSTVLCLNRKIIEELSDKESHIRTDDTDGFVVNDVVEEDTGDWMTRILQSDLFSKLPASNIQKIFARIEPIQVSKGETIIEQDKPGDYFYIIEVGRAEVSRKPSEHARSVKLNDLTVGDYFGEEALVSNCPRNANVVMLTDGEIMRLSKLDFMELIREAILLQYEPEQIKEMHNAEFTWIDVRFPDECHKNTRFEKLNIPLNLIRMQIERLDTDTKYIVCCEDGKKSAVAAFLLSQKGFEAAYIKGGLINCRNQSSEGLNLDFLDEKSDKSSSSVIEFIPRKKLTETDEKIISESVSNSDDIKVESATMIPEANHDNEPVSENTMKPEEAEMKATAEQVSELENENSNTSSQEILSEQTESVPDKEAEITEQETDKINSSVYEQSNKKEELDNTDAVKKLLDHYRLEQEKTLSEIRSNAEMKINNELNRIKELYKEKEEEINNLKKLKEAVSRRLRQNAPILTEEVSREEIEEKDKKEIVETRHTETGTSGEIPRQEIKPQSEEIEKSDKETDSESKTERDRNVLNKRYKILNDSRFREHIRQLNIKKDEEFKQAMNACKSMIDDEGQGKTGDIDVEQTPLPKQEIKDQIRPIDDKSDRTIEEDISAWIREQEAFENDPQRLEFLEKRRKLMQDIDEQSIRSKRVNKIHDRSLLRDIKSALQDKD